MLGVDGCPGGWVGAEVTGEAAVAGGWAGAGVTGGAEVAGGRVRWHVADLLDRDVEAVGIDMPIGLPEAGTRACDREARARLGRARSSVFFAPPRAALGATTHAEAVAAARDRAAPGLSIQAWHIVARITELDRWITPDRQRKVVEVHPELSFCRLDPRVVEPKRTAPGAGQRIRALQGRYDLGELPRGVPRVDALDALAAAWSAARHLAGTAEVLGGDRDARGLRMEIRV